MKVLTGHVANFGVTSKEVDEKLENIRGHLVIFPTKFLNQENLLGSIYVPVELFT